MVALVHFDDRNPAAGVEVVALAAQIIAALDEPHGFFIRRARVRCSRPPSASFDGAEIVEIQDVLPDDVEDHSPSVIEPPGEDDSALPVDEWRGPGFAAFLSQIGVILGAFFDEPAFVLAARIGADAAAADRGDPLQKTRRVAMRRRRRVDRRARFAA